MKRSIRYAQERHQRQLNAHGGLLQFIATTPISDRADTLSQEAFNAIMDNLWSRYVHTSIPTLMMSMKTCERFRVAQQAWAMTELRRRTTSLRRRQARKQNRRRN